MTVDPLLGGDGHFRDDPELRAALARPPWVGWTGDDAGLLCARRPRLIQGRSAPVADGLAGRVRRRRGA